ncbi:MAG: hypothetical protein HQL94_10770 [Magnetococcales bacterium]|nr:hypothetical protein [Magnetococcales bacterium]
MKIEEWFGLLGLLAAGALIAVALFPDDAWDRESAVDSSVKAISRTGVWPTPPSAAWQPQTAQQPQMVPVVTVQPAPIGARQIKPGLMRFEQAPKVRFNGPIQQISETPGSDGQIHVWLHDPQGGEMHLSVGPAWFLHYMGCVLTHDAVISGIGFQFDDAQRAPMVYVKKIVTGTQTCQMRNDEGFALWSNQLR